MIQFFDSLYSVFLHGKSTLVIKTSLLTWILKRNDMDMTSEEPSRSEQGHYPNVIRVICKCSEDFGIVCYTTKVNKYFSFYPCFLHECINTFSSSQTFSLSLFEALLRYLPSQRFDATPCSLNCNIYFLLSASAFSDISVRDFIPIGVIHD